MFYCTFSSRSPHSNTQDKRRKSEPRSDTQSQRHSRTRCRYVETDISFPFSSRLDRGNSRRSNHRFSRKRNSSFLNSNIFKHLQTSSIGVNEIVNNRFPRETKNESTFQSLYHSQIHQELSFPFFFRTDNTIVILKQ